MLTVDVNVESGALLERLMGSNCVLEKFGVRPLVFIQNSTILRLISF